MEINICPDWVLKTLRVPSKVHLHVGYFISALAVLTLTPLVRFIPHICLFRSLLHIPCPGCGVSHSLISLCRFDFPGVWAENPAGLGIAALLAFQIIARPVAVFFTKTESTVSTSSRFISRAAGIWILIVWALRLIDGGLHGSNFLFEM
jgi:hypothetical protein